MQMIKDWIYDGHRFVHYKKFNTLFLAAGVLVLWKQLKHFVDDTTRWTGIGEFLSTDFESDMKCPFNVCTLI